MKVWPLLAAAIAGAGCAGPQPAEAPAALPPYPPRGEFLEFFVAATSEFRFFIEAGSVSLADGGVVRYVLIARSPSGAVNVSFEGMRCDTGEVRAYATGGEAGWVGKPGEWRTAASRSVQRWHVTLANEYFCPQRQAINRASEGVDALRRRGHPFSRGLTDDIPRGF